MLRLNNFLIGRYIYPVLDLDFVYGAVATSSVAYNEEAKPVLVTVFPFNSKGSLKDLIYRVSNRCPDN